MTTDANAETSQLEQPQMTVPEDTETEKSPKATSQQPDSEISTPGFGWTHYAEQINGRFAMIGFVALLLTELVTRQDFFTWIGLR